MIDLCADHGAARITPLEAVLAADRKSAGREEAVEILETTAAHERESAAFALRCKLERVAQSGWNPHGVGRCGELQQSAVNVQKQSERALRNEPTP